MPYLIDGHNLIGRLPGHSLEDPEDERRLMEALSAHLRRARRKAVVFFDRAAPDSRGFRLGLAEARFASPPRTADAMLLDHLRRQPDRRGYTVVTSDAEVSARARALGANVVAADDFARSVRSAQTRRKKEDPPAKPEDLAEWLSLFGEDSPPPAR